MGDDVFAHTTSISWSWTFGTAVRTLAAAMSNPGELDAEKVLLLTRRWYGNTRARKINDITAWRGFIPMKHMLVLNEAHFPEGITHITFAFRCADISAVVFIEMFSEHLGKNAYGDPLHALIRYGEHTDLYLSEDAGSEDVLILGVGSLANVTYQVSQDRRGIWYPVITAHPDIASNLELHNFLVEVMG
jgi:hypothetical protein